MPLARALEHKETKKRKHQVAFFRCSDKLAHERLLLSAIAQTRVVSTNKPIPYNSNDLQSGIAFLRCPLLWEDGAFFLP
jgi:hypothetical protein